MYINKQTTAGGHVIEVRQTKAVKNVKVNIDECVFAVCTKSMFECIFNQGNEY